MAKYETFIVHVVSVGHVQQTNDPQAAPCSLGKPVIGGNPVFLSSPDGRKWQRRVSVDNGHTRVV